MEDQTPPIDLSLEIQKSEDIAEVFIGYTTADGEDIILASAAPPARASLQSSRLHSE